MFPKIVCQTYERFSAVSQVLQNMLLHLSQQAEPSARLLKHIVRCYLRLSENPHARGSLKEHLPKVLRDDTFVNVLSQDATIKKWVTQLLLNVGEDLQQHQVDGGMS
jgi:CCR4-NOT transcription complex subunit 9